MAAVGVVAMLSRPCKGCGLAGILNLRDEKAKWASHKQRRETRKQQLQAAGDRVRQQAAVLAAIGNDEAEGEHVRLREVTKRLLNIAPCIDAQVVPAIERKYVHSARTLVSGDVQTMGCAAKHIFY